MRYKMNEDEKKQSITISINNELNNIIETDMKDNNRKKSQIIEDAMKLYFNDLENSDMTEEQMRIKNK